MLKIKIWFTIFALYEIIAIALLHYPMTCNMLFPLAMCTDKPYKYFIMCVAVPLIIFLIVMWLHEIFVAHRRRREFLNRAENILGGVLGIVRGEIERALYNANLEKRIANIIPTTPQQNTKKRKKK